MSFYQYMQGTVLDQGREFYEETVKPVALILGIKKDIQADVFYKRLRAQPIPPPSVVFPLIDAKQKTVV